MTLISRHTVAVTLCVIALIGAAIPACAQTSYMRATIPFAFNAGKTSLPAGEYKMQMDQRTNVLQFQPVAANVSYSVMLSAGSGNRGGAQAGAGILRFQKVNEQFYLGEVWQPAHDMGNKLSVPKSVERARGGIGALSTVDVTIR